MSVTMSDGVSASTAAAVLNYYQRQERTGTVTFWANGTQRYVYHAASINEPVDALVIPVPDEPITVETVETVVNLWRLWRDMLNMPIWPYVERDRRNGSR